jgi:YfiH family protein
MWSEEDGFFRNDGLRALGIVHGVTTRRLGSMKSPEARAAALSFAGAEPASLQLVHQVHGRRVVRFEELGGRQAEADAIAAERPGAAFGVFVADCQPLFVWESTGRAVAVAHLGWRGTAAGLAKAAVETLVRDYGQDPRELHAAIGPHIRSCCYEVGAEVAAKFPASCRRTPVGSGGTSGREHLELSAAATLQLVEAGLPAASIDASGPCTHCHPDLFYSFRREKADLRMLAFIVMP